MSASTKDLLALSESILAETEPAKAVVPVGADPIVDDGLKDVVVPDDFVSDILNFSGRLNEAEALTPEEEPVQTLNEATLTEEKVLSLVERLKALINEAREVMTEMTTTGMIGGGTQKKLMMVRKPKKAKGKKKG